MTARLIALMSAVLLLSLAALALLMGHLQREVMSELQRTVTAVGRETIRSLDLPPLPPGAAPAPEAGPAPGTRKEIRHVVIRRSGDRMLVREDGGPEQVVELPPGAKLPPSRNDGIVAHAWGHGEVDVAIHVDDVRAEADPGHGFVLRIPTRRPPGQADVLAFRAAPGTVRQREIVLPVPTAHYQDLFASVRRRSLLLFLAVLGLGVALSAALAARVTRPLRQLDDAIHRLAKGDLAVSVEARGNDEVGRLGRAFNEMAAELARSRDRARDLTRKEKLSALGRLASGVAHDVRNPLHSIGLTLQHIHETCRPAEAERQGEFDRSLDLIRAEIRRLDRLVSNFLAFARSERRPRGPVDLAPLVHEVVGLVEKEAERRGVKVEVAIAGAGADGAGGVGTVTGDGEAIRSSLLNLVLNAFAAMSQGGTLTLRLQRAAGELQVVVADDGCGIPPEEQEKVFEFAYSTRDGGTGLGLAMVHQVVVEEHGGRVQLRSRPGEGTEVTLAFPLAPLPDVPPVPPGPAPRPGPEPA